MPDPHISNGQQDLSIKPLGAGDLIDRAVRLYRQNFRTLLLIAAPPVMVGAAFLVVWRFAMREMFGISSSAAVGGELVLYYVFTALGSALIWFLETVATLVVMGGASRNFVRSLLFGEPLSFRETYRNVRSRLAGLTVASMLIAFVLSVVGVVVFYLSMLALGVSMVLIAATLEALPFLLVIAVVLAAAVIVLGGGALFFLAASRFAYVPQVMMVEGQSVGAAIARSTSLASGNLKRLAALFIFTTVATYSALAILYVPLGWIGWLEGVEIISGNADSVPAWYELASQLIGQASVILMSPVWMIGLCLLYVDERVRSEGYDIELMAARSLGEIPAVPPDHVNPLQPALAGTQASAPARDDGGRLTTLGLG
ncbi:MAG: hypothetical protein ACK4S4_07325 [Pyrinomonadaceae bacterium]